MKRLGIGLSLPVGLQPIEKIIHLVERSEKLNFDSFWIHENPMYGDSLIALALITKMEGKIKLGIGCTSVVTRHPIMLASSSITLQNLAKGRFILGLGLGGFPWLPLIGYPIQPIKETKPLKRILETVSIVRALTSGREANLEGNFFKVKNFKLMVKSEYYIPIYIASLSKKTLSLSPSIADGVITSPGVMTIKDLERMVSWVKEGENKYKKRVNKAAYLLVSVSKDEREAYNAIKKDPYFIYQLSEVVPKESLRDYGVNLDNLEKIREAWRKRDVLSASSLIGDDMVRSLTLVGKKENVISSLESYLKIDYDLFILSPVGDLEEALITFSPLNE